MSFLNDQRSNRSNIIDSDSNRVAGLKEIETDKPRFSPSLWLEQERQAIAGRFDQYNQVSDTASMNSITTTNDSFNWMGSPESQQQQHSYDDSNNYTNGYREDDINYGSPHGTSSKMSSHLLDSNLRDPEDRGNLNLGYNRDSGNMDYMQEDPYSGHRLPPHHDPYYSGGNNYGGNTSFEPPHSEQSFHSDYNRQPPSNSYSDLPNGRGPHSGGYHHPSEHNGSLHQHQQSRSLSPNDHHRHDDYHYQDDGGGGGYRGDDAAGDDGTGSGHHGHVGGGGDEGLPPYHDDAVPQSYNDYEDYNSENMGRGPVSEDGDNHYYNDGTSASLPQQRYQEQNSPGNYYDENPPPPKPPLSGRQSLDLDYEDDRNFDPQNHHHDGYDDHTYPDQSPSHQRRYPEALHDLHGERDDSYAGSYQGEPPPHSSGNYMDPYPTSASDNQGYPDGIYSHGGGHPSSNYSFHGDPQQGVAENPVHNDPHDQYPRPEDYREIHNQSSGAVDVPYLHDDYNPQHPQQQQQQNGSFNESYNQPPPQQQQGYDPYAEDDRYSGHHSLDHSRGGPPYNDQGSQPQYDDRGPPYDDRGPPYDDRAYNDRGGGSPYNYRPDDMPDSYGGHPQNQGYPEDYPDNGSNYGSTQPRGENPYYPTPEHEVMQRMDQMNLNAPPPVDGRMTPVDDGGLPQYFDSRGPDLQQVIDLMSSPDDNVVSSAVAYLQHLTYMDDAIKAKTRGLGGIPLLISLLSHESVPIHKNACGAIQNLSYGRSNNDNKRAIKNENGIPELIRLLRKTKLEDVLESVTGVLWNLSSCEDLKHAIIEDGLSYLMSVLMTVAIAKYAGFDTVVWSPVCRNVTGILRNVSSAGFEARKQLRECKGLVDTLIYMLRIAIRDETDLDSKPIENIVCILRNLSYRIQEVVEPDFHKKRNLTAEHQSASKKGKQGEVGCFGNKGKAKPTKKNSTKAANVPPPALPPLSTEYRALWSGEIHNFYSVMFRRCTNPITLEAAAGAIQNLTACDWQPAIDSRMMIRKEKGLPLMVDLLSSESDRVLCATATALRNLAIDEKNKELIGKYSIRQLAVRLPKDNRNNMPDDTICAIVATLYEVVKDNQDFAMALIEDGLPSLMHINRSERRYLARTLKFTSTLLKTMWTYKSLHSEYATFKYYAADFTTSTATPRQEGSRPPDVTSPPHNNTGTMSSHHGHGGMPPTYNTLSRPISSQGISGQGWDDNTLSSQRMQAMQQQPQHQQQPSPYTSRHQPSSQFPQQQQNPHGSFYGTANPRMTPTPSVMRGDLNRSNASIHDQRDDGNYSRGGRQQPEEIHMNDFGAGYAPLDEPQPHRTKPPIGGVPLFPGLSPGESSSPYPGDNHSAAGNEPLYAQVNKGSRRRLDLYDGGSSPRTANHSQDAGGEGGGVDSWV